MSLEVAIEKRGEDDQDSFAKLQQEYQELRTERDGLKTTNENIHAERDQLQSKVGEWETQRATMEETEKQFQVQATYFKGQIASLAASLKEAK